MSEIMDKLAVCVYCGEISEVPNAKQIKIFGKPECCGYDMLTIDRSKLHAVVRALDKLKANLEAELLKGTL